MDIRQLIEALDIYQDGKFKYADIDAAAVYANCVNKDHGSHTFEEADEFKKFVGIDENTTEEELRAIRNTLVRYWADNMDKTDKGFKMGDQMQFFTTVIDMAIDNLPKEVQESLIIDNTKIKNITEDLNKVLNEGMWASPFTVENAKIVKDLLSKPITFAELDSDEMKQKLWNVIGDDEFWDGVAEMVDDFADNDARSWISSMLQDWIDNKNNFVPDAYSIEAEKIIKSALVKY